MKTKNWYHPSSFKFRLPSYVDENAVWFNGFKVDITGVANTSLDIRGIELSKFFTSKTESLKRLLERIPVR